MTLQQIFNKVAAHLLTQNAKSELPPVAFPDADYDESTCAYRGSNGTACAIGCLISDEHYDAAELEGRQVTSTAVREALRASDVPLNSRTMELLINLQRVHDDYPPQDWPGALKRVAYSHRLEMPT